MMHHPATGGVDIPVPRTTIFTSFMVHKEQLLLTLMSFLYLFAHWRSRLGSDTNRLDGLTTIAILRDTCIKTTPDFVQKWHRLADIVDDLDQLGPYRSSKTF
jgi:hypothetical protein